MTLYCTVDEVRQWMRSNRTIADNILLSGIRQVSQRIDRTFYRRRAPFFAPVIETRDNYQLSGSRVNSIDGTFYFGDPLLSLTGVIVGTQTLVVGTTVQLFQGEYAPYDTLQLTDRCCNGWYRYVTCAGCVQLQFVTISGTWGYNVDPDNMWLDSLQTIQNVGGIDADDTSITVTDVDGANANGYTPCLSAGNLIQIDSEWMEVTATNTTSNTFTVKRAVNGSTAAAHNQSTAIYVYQVEEAIKRATYRQVGMEYAKIGGYDNQDVPDLSNVAFPADVLAEFKALLNLYANK